MRKCTTYERELSELPERRISRRGSVYPVFQRQRIGSSGQRRGHSTREINPARTGLSRIAVRMCSSRSRFGGFFPYSTHFILPGQSFRQFSFDLAQHRIDRVSLIECVLFFSCLFLLLLFAAQLFSHVFYHHSTQRHPGWASQPLSSMASFRPVDKFWQQLPIDRSIDHDQLGTFWDWRLKFISRSRYQTPASRHSSSADLWRGEGKPGTAGFELLIVLQKNAMHVLNRFNARACVPSPSVSLTPFWTERLIGRR